METKISLVPTRNLAPQGNNEKSHKVFFKTNSPKTQHKNALENKENIQYIKKEVEHVSHVENEKQDHIFLCNFPRAPNYSNMETIIQNFPHLKDINKLSFNLEGVQDMKCFIMRSNNEDDIHKAIKYGIWTSTNRSNNFLDYIYRECCTKGVPIYLLYSVVRSGQFSAVAKLSSGVIPKHFQFWWEDKKWLNHFEVKWVFIKDVPYKSFSDLFMDDGTPVVRARDCTSIPVDTAKDILKIFRDYKAPTTILDAFYYMDVREDMMRYSRYLMQTYQNNIAARESQKLNDNKKNRQANQEPMDDLEVLLEEFETMLNFYATEKAKLQQEVEEILGMINVSQQVSQVDLEGFLPDYQDLKCREKEIEEGLGELEAKYQDVYYYEKNRRADHIQNEKRSTKFQALEGAYRNLLEEFGKDKQNMTFFTQKIFQLNITSYRYIF